MTQRRPSEEKIWLKHLPKEQLESEMAYQTLYDTVSQVCNEYPDNKAIYFYGTSINYTQMKVKIEELASSFYGLGIREGDMVSFLAPTTPETIFCLYALNKLGAIPNFIDPRMDVNRILDAAEGVHSRLLITIDIAWPKVAKILDQLTVEKIITMSPYISLKTIPRLIMNLKTKLPKIPYSDKILTWDQLLAAGKGVSATPKAEYKDGSIAAITYTGGTTGTPKGVLLTNDGLNTMAESFRRSGVDHENNDRFLEIMPIFASYGIGCGIHMPISFGLELIVIPKFTPDQLGGMIKKYKPNHMMAVPSFYEQIMHSKALWDVDLSFLKTTGCGGDTMNPGLQSRFNKFMKEHGGLYPLSQGYGLSEMSGAATCCFSAIYKDDSCGIPLLATTLGIFDPDTGEELGYNQEGEVCVTGRNMMVGYYNKPDEPAEIMQKHADGTTWIHTGDIGVIDEDGFVFIRGRIKQIIIKFDGHKVFPVSIEGILNSHKMIRECAVIGIQDPDHAQGEVPFGLVTLKDTAQDMDKEALRRELMQFCYEKCEERGRPSDIIFIDEMLYTGLHKHDYRKLKELYKDHQIRN